MLCVMANDAGNVMANIVEFTADNFAAVPFRLCRIMVVWSRCFCVFRAWPCRCAGSLCLCCLLAGRVWSSVSRGMYAGAVGLTAGRMYDRRCLPCCQLPTRIGGRSIVHLCCFVFQIHVLHIGCISTLRISVPQSIANSIH